MSGRFARRLAAAGLVALALFGAGALLAPPDADGIPGFDDNDDSGLGAAPFFAAAALPPLAPLLDAPRVQPAGSSALAVHGSTEDASATLPSRAPPRS